MNHTKQATGGPGQPTETALFAQAQAGCRDSLNRLMATHEDLVHAVVRRQALGCLPFREALQAGRIGLWHAILGYDLQRGLAFSTYAWRVIMHRIWREVKLAERADRQGMKHPPLQAVEASTVEMPLPEKGWESAPIVCAVWDLASRLPERLRVVVLARYGLTGQGRAFYPRIGALLGVSAERARQLHTEALRPRSRPVPRAADGGRSSHPAAFSALLKPARPAKALDGSLRSRAAPAAARDAAKKAPRSTCEFRQAWIPGRDCARPAMAMQACAAAPPVTCMSFCV